MQDHRERARDETYEAVVIGNRVSQEELQTAEVGDE
jgi:hypothetical protein